MLGQMIKRVREATGGALLQLQTDLNTLNDLNDYSRHFHHGNAQPTATPNEEELRTHAGRAIAYVQGNT